MFFLLGEGGAVGGRWALWAQFIKRDVDIKNPPNIARSLTTSKVHKVSRHMTLWFTRIRLRPCSSNLVVGYNPM
jgi:hypothetical protein